MVSEDISKFRDSAINYKKASSRHIIPLGKLTVKNLQRSLTIFKVDGKAHG